MQRRIALALCSAALSIGAARADEGHQLADHRELMARGESALAAGEAGAAVDAFERAASAHDVSAELALVRARMQMGEYRAAVSLAAHVAGEHPQAAPLYAQLLAVGGQPEQAELVMLDAGGALPASSAKPAAFGATPPSSARVIGTALLVDRGRAAITPAELLSAHRSFWLRNGLGQTVRVAAYDGAQGFAKLTLEAPLPADAHAAFAPREPFAGSPGYVVGYASEASAQASWPQLHAGFLGTPTREGSARHLGIAAPAGFAGAAVFDAAGRVAGLTLPGTDGEALWRPLPSSPAAAATTTPRATPIPADALYERALRLTLQLISAD